MEVKEKNPCRNPLNGILLIESATYLKQYKSSNDAEAPGAVFFASASRDGGLGLQEMRDE